MHSIIKMLHLLLRNTLIVYGIGFFCLFLAACVRTDSVHPFNDEQARIMIHDMYPQIDCRPCQHRGTRLQRINRSLY